MGYNSLNVTAGQGDTVSGPLYYRPVPLTERIEDFDFDPLAEGFIRLGEAHTDGFESSQSADAQEKRVWGDKLVGKKFSNFTDTAIIRLASSTDSDVLGAIFGRENVEVVTVGGKKIIKLKVGARTPEFASWLIQTITDDGRKHWHVIYSGQVDPTVTRTFNDSDIVVIETTITAKAVTFTDGTDIVFNHTHEELIEAVDEVVAPIVPEG